MSDRPEFKFLVNFPENAYDIIEKKPPLGSSIQNFETCLLLISLERYPAALTICATALESAWKAANGEGIDCKVDLHKIYGEINAALPKDDPSFDLKAFRHLRNDIVHWGFSPKDDERSAKMIFETGIPVLFSYIKNHPSLDVDFKTWLDSDLFEHLRLTLDLNKKGRRHHIPAIESSTTLRHQIERMTLRQTMWQESALDDEPYSQQLEFEVKQHMKEWMFENWHCHEEFRCPVCTYHQLVVELDEASLKNRILKGVRARCINCDLFFPNRSNYLLNILLEEQLSHSDKEQILVRYGV